MKLLLEVAVCPATVTEIGPVVAVGGTMATRMVEVAEVTLAGTPPNNTKSDEMFVLKP
jgi:hypothetical protein